MRIVVLIFPGSNRERDLCAALALVTGREPVRVWHRDTTMPKCDLIVLPGGFAYGDYLRCGAMAAHSPIMRDVRERAADGVPILGICNGFQILQEARLLPGALLRNASCEFRCEWVNLRVEQSESAFTHDCRPGQVLRIPISHGEGNFFADPDTLDAIERNGQVVFRYCASDGRVTADSNPNGSLRNIAGIANARGNVVGMMPHPERACEDLLGGTDGLAVFRSAIHALARVAA